jgi:hypothetical protein
MGKATGGGRAAGGAGGGSKGRSGGSGGRPGGASGSGRGASGSGSGSGRGGGREGTGPRPGGAPIRGSRGASGASRAPGDRREARRRWARAHHRHYHNELSYQGDYDFRPRRSTAQTVVVLVVFGLILLALLWLGLVLVL